MLLLDRLARDAQDFGDLRERPPVADRRFDVLVFEPVGEPPQAHRGGQPVGRIERLFEFGGSG